MQRVFQKILSLQIAKYVRVRQLIWHRLHRIQPHPVSRHVRRQLNDLARLPILMITLLWGGVVMMGMVVAFSRLGAVTILLLPLCLMIFSSSYILLWLYRSTVLLKQQHRNAVLDSINVIPPGGEFVTLAICHGVMNEADRLGWLRLLRQMVVLMIMAGTSLAILIAASQITTIALSDVVRVLVDITFMCLLLYLEHQQSVLIACFTAIILPQYLSHHGNLISNVMAIFVLIQFATWTIPLLAVVLLSNQQQVSMMVSLNIMLFLTIREGILFVMYRSGQQFE